MSAQPGPFWTRFARLAGRALEQLGDPAQLNHYRAANAALLADADPRPRVVFMGDSIFEHWRGLEALSPGGLRYLNRAIAGQTSGQILARLQDDSLVLAPRVVVILAGTNDVRAFLGDPATVGARAVGRMIRNIRAMADMAGGRGVKVVLCALAPIRPGLGRAWGGAAARDIGAIRAANARLRSVADELRCPLVDFHGALVDGEGLFDRRLTDDGLHPNLAGYDRMAAALRTAAASFSAS